MSPAQDLLRIVTAGSVDDGKSTLLGRLLYDTGSVPEDERSRLRRECGQGPLEFARLLDGLEAERQQGITIDVAYRYFRTPRRRFVIADAPGHEQYTRNMATAASTSDVAILLVDAGPGFLPQSRRHALIAATMGIRHFVVAVNKMDLLDWREEAFRTVEAEARACLARFPHVEIRAVPISALHGDNVTERSTATPWYGKAPLLHLLEEIRIERKATSPFLLPIQWVVRTPDFRGYAGTVAAGRVERGDPLCTLPSGEEARVTTIHTPRGPVESAGPGEAVVLVLDREIDLMRGDLLAALEAAVVTTQEVEATVVWMADEPLRAEATLLLKQHHHYLEARVARILGTTALDSGEPVPAVELPLNAIGRVRLELSRPIAATRYAEDRTNGALVLIDPIGGGTLGCALLERLRAADFLAEPTAVGDAERHRRLGQVPHLVVVRSTSGDAALRLAQSVERRFFQAGLLSFVIDADLDPALRLLARTGLVGILPLGEDAPPDGIPTQLRASRSSELQPVEESADGGGQTRTAGSASDSIPTFVAGASVVSSSLALHGEEGPHHIEIRTLDASAHDTEEAGVTRRRIHRSLRPLVGESQA